MIGLLLILIGPEIDGALAATVDHSGDARGHGALLIRDGTSKTILVAEGSAEASCGDADGDQSGGLVRLTVELRDARTGETFTGVVSPVEGNIDESGRVKVQFHFDHGEPTGQVFDARLQVRFFQQHR